MTADPLEELLAEFWSRREAGEQVDVETFATAHPEHAGALRSALAAMLATADLLPDATMPGSIGDYRVRSRLGRGASGEVFEVEDGTGRVFALKRLLPHAAAAQRANQRLRREAHVLRELRHPGIVAIADVGDDPATGLPFLVMERVAGPSLSAWLEQAQRRGRLLAAEALPGEGDGWQKIARLAAAVAEAVAAAHAAGVLHRDLKPGNVLLRADGTPVVVDFGLAADAAAATLTATGEVLGTPNYMAPEQARGEPATAASDVYGVGAILYELLTGAPPRHGSDALQVLADARHRLPVAPRSLDSAVPRELDLIARAAMAFHARHRPLRAADLAKALNLVAAGGRPIGLTLGWSQQLSEFTRRRRAPLLGVAGVTIAGLLTWIGLDWHRAARAEALRVALVAAAECHLDGDAAVAAAVAAAIEDSGQQALARWLTRTEPAVPDPVVDLLREGERALRGDPAAAEAKFAAAVALAPAAAIPVAWRAVAAAAAEHNDVAERELTSAIRLLPGSVRLRFELGRLLRKLKRPREALPLLQVAVTLPRADTATWNELAKACSAAGENEAGLTAVDKALSLAGPRQRLTAIRTKAALLHSMKRLDEALPLFKQVVDGDPGPEAWMSYGSVLDSLHRFDEAGAAYRSALELDAKNRSALLNLVFLHTGSDHQCAECRAWFAAHPGVLDVKLAEPFAIALLDAKDGLQLMQPIARYLQRVGGSERLLAAIEERMKLDLPAESLGLLMQAHKVLRPE